MLRIERLTLRLPAGYQHRAPAIARLVGEGLGQWRPRASQTITHQVAPPVRIPPQASDRAIAQAIVAGIVDQLETKR
jgi:hypothetical protein